MTYSARSAALLAAMLGLAISPNLLQKAEEEAELETERKNKSPTPIRKRHNDPEVAAKIRAEREARKKSNYLKRKGKSCS